MRKHEERQRREKQARTARSMSVTHPDMPYTRAPGSLSRMSRRCAPT